MIKNILLVAIGGALGSALRYFLNDFFSRKINSSFPFQTFFINFLGCLFIGILIGYFSKNQNDSLKLILATGFCGGFTTFSAFGLENYNLIQNNQYLLALIYIVSSLIIGIIAVGVGIYISK